MNSVLTNVDILEMHIKGMEKMFKNIYEYKNLGYLNDFCFLEKSDIEHEIYREKIELMDKCKEQGHIAEQEKKIGQTNYFCPICKIKWKVETYKKS